MLPRTPYIKPTFKLILESAKFSAETKIEIRRPESSWFADYKSEVSILKVGVGEVIAVCRIGNARHM